MHGHSGIEKSGKSEYRIVRTGEQSRIVTNSREWSPRYFSTNLDSLKLISSNYSVYSRTLCEKNKIHILGKWSVISLSTEKTQTNCCDNKKHMTELSCVN